MQRVAALVGLAVLSLAAAATARRVPVYDHTLTTLQTPAPPYNESHAKYIGRLVSVAYCHRDQVEAWTCPPCANVSRLDDVIVINDKSHNFQGMLGFTGDAILVAFRGSMDLANWVANLSFLQTRPWSAQLPKAAVHRGFYSTYDSIATQLVLALETLFVLHPHAPLLVAGHSLGAAVAAIAVVDLHVRHNITTHTLLTFGEPRVGNAAFVTRLLQVVPHMHRLTHWRDIVPHVPLEWQGYVHEPQEVWYTENATAYKLCSPTMGEDPSCSLQVPTISSFADHVVYLNISMSHLVC
ncbi:Aste57867_21729 [Aphanomyces stellatus]|uniref:Aste57867_21729 protein n=1 Tax=Aphanomyces stellatus TaxID=120398 RepID=A0A485LIA5_9STRA|nr:hypothetical protein As57867_021660 [Aphanomyces stellatus]VFT98398.1 Aste57867_21729 [Aphanomyces stellatus]